MNSGSLRMHRARGLNETLQQHAPRYIEYCDLDHLVEPADTGRLSVEEHNTTECED
jgi:hypothetical protein